MAKLYFDIGANYQEAERLASTIKDLEAKLKKVNLQTDPAQIALWSRELKAAKLELTAIATNAAKSGADIAKIFQGVDPKEIESAFATIGNNFKSSKSLIKDIKKTIGDNNAAIADAKERLEEYAKASEKAFRKNDAAGYAAAGKGMAAEIQNITKLSEQTENYKRILANLTNDEDEHSESLRKNAGVMENLLGGTDKYKEIMALLPGPLKKVVSGINGITAASLKFLATPLGAAVAALALAFASLKTYLTKTEEGQMRLAKISGTLKGVMMSLEDIAAKLGKALYDAFSHPGEALKKLATALKQDVLDRLTTVKEGALAFGQFFAKIGKGVNISTAFEELKTALANTPDGQKVQGVADALGNVANNATAAANAMAEIERKRLNLDLRESQWQVQKSKLGTRKAELGDIFRDTTVSPEARQAAYEEYISIIKKEQAMEVGFANERIALKQKELALTDTNSIEDQKELNSLITERNQIEAGYISELANTSRMRATIYRAAKNDEKELFNLIMANREAQNSLLEDSHKKRLEQIQIEYEKELREIEDLKENWEKEQDNKLTDEQRGILDEKTRLAEEKRAKSTIDLGKEVYEKYKSFKDQRLDLEKEYNEDSKALWEAFLKTGDIKFINSLNERAKAYKNALYELDKSSGGLNPLIFANSESLSDSLLSDAITATTDAINKCDPNNVEALTELYDKLHKFQSDQNTRNDFGFASIFSGISKLNGDELKSLEAAYKNETDPKKKNQLFQQYLDELSEAQQKVIKGFSGIGSAFGEIGSALEQFDGVLGDIGKTFSAIGAQSDILGKAFSGTLTKTEAISTGISGVIQLGSMVLTSIQNNKKAQEEWNRTVDECEQKYRMLALEALDYKQRNIFGIENPYKQAIDGAYQYGKAIEELHGQIANLNKGQVQTGTKKEVDWSNVGKGAAIGAGAGAAVGAGLFSWATAGIGAAIGAVTGAITGLLSAKTVPVLESLSSVYGELFDPNTYKLNDKILADYDKLDEDTKKVVDNWEEIREKALEAEQQMKDTFATLSGDVGKQLSDTLVEAFRNGDLYSAIDDFHSYMTGTIEDIIEQMIFSTVFGDMFDELEKRMDESFKGPNADNDITDDLIWMEGEYQKRLETFDLYMNQAKNSLSGQGYDAWAKKVEEQTATGGGFQVMSQDTGTELNGRFTALQISGENIDSGVGMIAENFSLFVERFATQLVAIDDIRNIQAQSLIELQGINENTLMALKPIREMNDTLGQIKTKVDRL